MTRNPTMTVERDVEAGEMLGGHQRHPLLDGLHLIVAQAGRVVNFLLDQGLVAEVVALDAEKRSVVG
jgi:hypothetical protein